jgi:hypothetical protein
MLCGHLDIAGIVLLLVAYLCLHGWDGPGNVQYNHACYTNVLMTHMTSLLTPNLLNVMYVIALALDKLLGMGLQVTHFWTLKECREHCTEHSIVVTGIEIMEVADGACMI